MLGGAIGFFKFHMQMQLQRLGIYNFLYLKCECACECYESIPNAYLRIRYPYS
jgi:hypothetical protein